MNFLAGCETFVSKGIRLAGAVIGPTGQLTDGEGEEDADDDNCAAESWLFPPPMILKKSGFWS